MACPPPPPSPKKSRFCAQLSRQPYQTVSALLQVLKEARQADEETVGGGDLEVGAEAARKGEGAQCARLHLGDRVP